MRIYVSFFRDESGATAIEYALVGGLISIACIGTMSTVGNTLLRFYNAIQTALAGALCVGSLMINGGHSIKF